VSFWGNLLKIVAIGAFFVATGPFGLAVGSNLATALRIGGVVLSYLGALIDRPRLLADRQKLFISTTLEPNTPIPVIYGRAKVGAIVADWFIQPVNNFKELYYVAVLCHGSRDGLGVAGIDEIWLDGRKAIDVTTGARIWPYKPITANYKIFLGTTIQNVGGTPFFTDGAGIGIQAPGSVAGSGWNLTTDLGKGLCVIGFVFVNVDTSSFSDTAIAISTSSVANPTVITTSTAHGFASGDSVRIAGHSGSTPTLNAEWVVTVISSTSFSIPEIVTVGGTGGTARRFSEGPAFHGPPSVSAIIRGNRIYDSRTDTWMPAGTNPAMCIRDYLLAPIYGCGFNQTLIHEQSFKDAADYCDVLVNYAVGAAVNISTSSVANPSIITTGSAHGFATSGTFIVRIAGHSGSTPSINGDWTATYVSPTSFSIPVNVTVGGTGGNATKCIQVTRATCNGVIDTARPTSDNLQELLSSCRGNLVWEQGQFKLTIRSPSVAAPTLTLSPSNIIGEWSFRNAGLEEKWNLVKASYVEPANGEFKVQDVQWPLVTATNTYLAADGAFTNNLELSLPFTNDQLMAQALAQLTLQESRFGISVQCRCTEEILSASVGDRVYVTHPTPGWTQKQFWVTALQLMSDTTVAVSLQEYDSTAYDLSPIDDRNVFGRRPFDLTIPPVTSVTGSSISGGGMLVTWVSPKYGQLDYYEVQAKCSSCGDDYTTITTVKGGASLTNTAVASLARNGQTWLAQVRIVDLLGRPGPWLESSPVVISTTATATPGTGELLYTGFAPTCIPTVTAPDVTAVTRVASGGDMCFSGGNWMHVVGWTVTGPNDTFYQTDIDVAHDAAGVTFVALVTGLTTVSSTFNDDTGVAVNLYGSLSPTTYYRTYKVKIVRKSDGAVVDSLTTTQGTITGYSENCA